jgi:hypothetical protein
MKITAYIMAAVLALAITVAGLSATASADDGRQGPGLRPGGKILDRVAQILNIDRQKLVDAFKQAISEVRQQNAGDRLDQWVKDGKLTQDQADQFGAWLAAKPAGTVVAPKAMDTLLKNGKITQAQYDTWKSWWDKKPNITLPKPDKPLQPGQNRPLLRRAPGTAN